MAGMRIAVTGASGLVGSALAHDLRRDGHHVVRLVRRAPRTDHEVEWDPHRQWVDAPGLIGCQAVVHLAGAGIADRRWSPARKRELRDSRVLGTAAIAEAVASLDTPPDVLVSGSAIGIYGDTADRRVDEDTPPGHGFLADLCQEWEEAAEPAVEAGIRTAYARTGLGVARAGGAWGRMFPLFRLGLGGRLGSGDQYWSFIALRDEVAALRHIIATESLVGPVNLTAPNPVTNPEVTAAKGRVLGRPTALAVPRPALRLALGELSSDVLGSQRVIPQRLLDSGFSFDHPTIDGAIEAAWSDR
ncbi:TIGR01777 family oxidoreductase [Streptomyces sp. HSW2009]|uniref:TIGR01777 family oxidoreductase n=1 Tax=Streptomyces sp. HSW2009 TaxID=3142890 RepID=UPI0032EC546D